MRKEIRQIGWIGQTHENSHGREKLRLSGLSQKVHAIRSFKVSFYWLVIIIRWVLIIKIIAVNTPEGIPTSIPIHSDKESRSESSSSTEPSTAGTAAATVRPIRWTPATTCRRIRTILWCRRHKWRRWLPLIKIGSTISINCVTYLLKRIHSVFVVICFIIDFSLDSLINSLFLLPRLNPDLNT